MPEHVIGFFDGPNADNLAAAWGAFNAFDSDAVRLAGIVVSATAVNYAEDSPLGSRDIPTSRRIHALHTARMAGMFARAGADVPVFFGLDIEETSITTTIPHRTHVRHEDYDLYGDATGQGRQAIAGDFNAALAHMVGLPGTVHIVAGGPLSEVARLSEHPAIAAKLGHLAAQAAFAPSSKAVYSKLAFNVEVDMAAALQTFLHYPGAMYNVPSDITRHQSVTFQSAEALTRLGIHQELADAFLLHRGRAEVLNKEERIRQQAAGRELRSYPDLSIHDLQAVMALEQALGMQTGLYTFSPMDIAQSVANLERVAQFWEGEGLPRSVTPELVRQLGHIGGNATAHGEVPPRYVVISQNSAAYKQRVPELLRPRQ